MKYGKYVVVWEKFNGDEFNPEWRVYKLFTLDQSERCQDENDARRIAMAYWNLDDKILHADDGIVKVYMPETHDPNFTLGNGE